MACVGRRVPLNLCGAVALHLGIIGLCLTSPPARLGGERQLGQQGAGVVRINVVTSASAAAQAVETPSASTGAKSGATSRAVDADGVGKLATMRAAGEAATGAAGPAGPSATAAGGVGTASASDADANLASEYEHRLRLHILSYFRYPEQAARENPPEGTVGLRFEVDRDGRVRRMWVEQSSGSDILDAAAMDALRRAAPLPPIPDGLPERLTVGVPLLFNANG